VHLRFFSLVVASAFYEAPGGRIKKSARIRVIRGICVLSFVDGICSFAPGGCVGFGLGAGDCVSICSMLNPASGGASVGVWGRNPSAVKIILTECVNGSLICCFLCVDGSIGFLWSAGDCVSICFMLIPAPLFILKPAPPLLE